MSRTRHSPSLSDIARQERTQVLFRQIAEDPDRGRRKDLLDEVTVLNMPVAHSIAWRFRGRGCAMEDLEQTAYLALVRAVQDYDPSRGHHFLSYAVPCVTGTVKRYFRDSGWTVRPPRLVQELQQRLEVASRDVDPTTGRGPSDEQLAHTLGVAASSVREAQQSRGCFTPSSLDHTIGDSGATLGDLMVAPDDGSVEAIEARALLRPALAHLSAGDRSVLRMRFVEEQNQTQMAEALGTSQPAVSRLLARILHDLRAVVTEKPGCSTAA